MGKQWTQSGCIQRSRDGAGHLTEDSGRFPPLLPNNRLQPRPSGERRNESGGRVPGVLQSGLHGEFAALHGHLGADGERNGGLTQ